MNAAELKFADGKPTGLWYCGKCREIFLGVALRSRAASEHHREKAEECCTGATTWIPSTCKFGGECTGCKRPLKKCICGRASKNCCVACGKKLFQKEGKKVRWGTEIREVCYACSKNPDLAPMLVDAAKQPKARKRKGQ